MTACGVEVKTPQTETKESPQQPTQTQDAAEKTDPNPLDGVCSYNDDESKGCLKATIASTNLSVDGVIYEMGIKEFARNFPTDLVENQVVELEEDQTIDFSRRVTEKNFHSNFSVIVEGSHTTYDSINLGQGNIQVNDMAPGRYTISLSKDFDLKVTNIDGQTVGFKCATVETNVQVEVRMGRETAYTEAISEFEVRVDRDRNCAGATSR
jgi:hypothetical protein